MWSAICLALCRPTGRGVVLLYPLGEYAVQESVASFLWCPQFLTLYNLQSGYPAFPSASAPLIIGRQPIRLPAMSRSSPHLLIATIYLLLAGTDDWEELVPSHVRDQIKSLHLLGYNPNLQKLLHGNANVNGNGKLPELKSSEQPAQVAPK